MLPDGYPLLATYLQIPDNDIYKRMENFSDRFLQTNSAILSYYSKRWVVDPLHTWSRRWEYLFVYERLKLLAEKSTPLRLLDAGSGLTFFPHFVADCHPNVLISCCDNDRHLCAANLEVSAANAVFYIVTDISMLTYPSRSFDVVYCISVLEHCDSLDAIVKEFARVLKPNGTLIVTIDVSLDNRSKLTYEGAVDLIRLISQRFTAASDYEKKLESYDEAEILTTAYCLKNDPALLPWRQPKPHRISLRQRTTLDYLTCFCMSFLLPM
jgi:SAM-dependent methyltransferase